ncbi:TPA: hypothetical protein DEP58_03190 [Patescibacteria group bacterium]|nr:MAG: hypothetical protein UU98_C0028G0003 [Parcubacteria group bacterium GW2011_GWD2_42_14]HCC05285.1 hypothetical protein [Patescibacteria group bacterium]
MYIFYIVPLTFVLKHDILLIRKMFTNQQKGDTVVKVINFVLRTIKKSKYLWIFALLLLLSCEFVAALTLYGDRAKYGFF